MHIFPARIEPVPDRFGMPGRCLLHFPPEVSAVLPSKGMVPVRLTVSGEGWATVLEPDGAGGRWCLVPRHLSLPSVAISPFLEVCAEWPEPLMPSDLADHLILNLQALTLWQGLTTAARWDWIRWMGATQNPNTRAKRVLSVASRLLGGKRRPCCFNRETCTLTDAMPS